MFRRLAGKTRIFAVVGKCSKPSARSERSRSSSSAIRYDALHTVGLIESLALAHALDTPAGR
jgi:hypothetical protein